MSPRGGPRANSGGRRPGAGRKAVVEDGQQVTVYLPRATLDELARYRAHLGVDSVSQALVRVLAAPPKFSAWRRAEKKK